ncbi:MAG TPA: hypothetical protein IAA98_08780 [Candidatus Avipropionibacterium avicola]|uniref:Uncharacterized protein n=1 Tax=Candidatus Avipropionibacterium avicola TaxID=2840701 RepID=A0A9D1GZK3_9ACTN|nr:hypothetical protein [Candidatus Avipropionibacterium avicola]
MSENTIPEERPVTHVEKVGAFDIRNFIGALIGLYGIILVVLGLVAFNEVEADRTGGLNANLWAGVGMVVVAALFILWARLEPLKVEVQSDPSGEVPTDIAPVEERDDQA